MNPYESQPKKAYWSHTFSRQAFADINTWHSPKFDISNLKIASAGSCFAQHIGKALSNSGFKYMDVEPAPDFLSENDWQDYGYGIYSARYGNVYTVRQLLQLAQRAFGDFKSLEPAWEYKGGVVDPYRPTLEPEPFGSVEEMRNCQRSHLNRVAELFSNTGLLIFTMGLTESYTSKRDGSVFPVCPGVAGGNYNDTDYQFVNFNYSEVVRDFNNLKTLLKRVNPRIRYLLTVSPVPLVATATDNNVGVATTYSKSVLRAAAGALSDGKGRVDYFPSYEIISMAAGEGVYYERNKRSVTKEGVANVMANVLQSFSKNSKTDRTPKKPQGDISDLQSGLDQKSDTTVCDEELLAQFGK